MIRVVKNCSIGMAWITSLPSIPPTSGPSAARKAVMYLRDVWLAKKKIERATSASAMNPRCVESHTKSHMWQIQAAAMGR